MALPKNPPLKHERVRELLSYDPEWGYLEWVYPDRPGLTGRIAGSVLKDGTRQVMIDGYKVPVARLVWFWHHGTWPRHKLYRVNKDTDDNRIENLADGRAEWHRLRVHPNPPRYQHPSHDVWDSIHAEARTLTPFEAWLIAA